MFILPLYETQTFMNMKYYVYIMSILFLMSWVSYLIYVFFSYFLGIKTEKCKHMGNKVYEDLSKLILCVINKRIQCLT